MFGPFNGPLPAGRYAIRASTTALTLTNVVSNSSVVGNTAFDDSNEFQQWDFEYGRSGYRIKNVASGTYLSYSPWAVPSRILNNSAGFIVGAANNFCEWRLIQTSINYQPRTFQIRVVAGKNLLPTEDYSLINNGWMALIASTSSTSWTLRALGTPGDLGTKSRNFAPGAKIVIRSSFMPQLALDVFQNGNNGSGLVLLRQVSGEDAQTWTCLKGGKGFRLKNVMADDNMGFATIANTPIVANSVVCQDDKAVEWQAVESASGIGYEIRLANDPKMLLTVWNADASENAWVYLSEGNAKGNGYTNQQWIFLPPGETIESEKAAMRISARMAVRSIAGEDAEPEDPKQFLVDLWSSWPYIPKQAPTS